MNDPLNGFKPKGALFECFMSFPQFYDDLEALIRAGYLKVTGSETCEWLKSKTSLAEYFKWTGGDAKWVPGGFWAPIENAFGIKRHTLRKLAGKNANPLKPDQSRDFKNIKKILELNREKERAQYNLLWAFRHIKRLVLEAEDEKPETVLEVIQKISVLFTRNVDKNRQKRR
jgi:hypothetical protein